MNAAAAEAICFAIKITRYLLVINISVYNNDKPNAIYATLRTFDKAIASNFTNLLSISHPKNIPNRKPILL